ncbi:MAG: hypothetical protein IT367_15165 [Candidatus Hydrogenedentes bacterium]|nr:hypothetical protein [Candidatus Hydrogenedentota bacterium]
MIDRADIVGIFECTGAGISSSRFRVLELWRGETPAGQITVHCTALVGERYVGALQKDYPQKIEMPSRMPGLGDPVGKNWLIEPDAEFSFYVCWGWVITPDEYTESLRYAFPDFAGSLDDLRAATRALPPPKPRQARPSEKPTPIPESKLEEVRTALKSIRNVKDEQNFRDWSNAIVTLAIFDPAFAAKRMAKIELAEFEFRYPAELAGFVSPLIWYAPTDERIGTARVLSSACEPMVRLVSAPYLVHSGNPKGRKVLEKLAGRSDGLAEWANFLLASYGETARMERAIDALGSIGIRRGTDAPPSLNYRDCLEVVLSNSAAASHIPQPGRPASVDRYAVNFPLKLLPHLKAWWERHKEKIHVLTVGTFPSE